MSQLFGALSGGLFALAGVSVTGAFTLLKGRKESADKERDRLELRLERQQEVRRAAYAGFLCACHQADDKFMDAWAAPLGEDSATAVVAAREAARSIREWQVTVALAGPRKMAGLTDDLCKKYTTELVVIKDLRQEHATDPGCAGDYRTPEQQRQVEERWDVHSLIVGEGRAVLGGDLPPGQ
ncbi:hypothetical protein OG819_55490 [Streptomyces sp. NBC_01549]|uniref:hypothetical protein n=1 Tax=Streptomyces sp. NBC_01549 TaxID=2975874 RepID=UPI00225B007C|nr:hypothetical protein [Streptomyces sp. NBC_01549]MCX4598362.1 hypothetical protein [Streptomyces sp. NBC_01549]